MAGKQALVYGGNGALGKACVTTLKNAGFKVFSVDFSASESADKSIVLGGKGWKEDTAAVKEQLKEAGAELDLVVSAAGGWSGGNIKSDAIFDSVDRMYNFNVQSAVAASHVAAHFLKENSLLVLIGAHAAFEGTAGMIGYGLSKASTHQLIRSLSGKDTGLPAGAKVMGLCPITLDTAMNRKFMADADFSTWTPLDFVGDVIVKWSNDQGSLESGSMFSLVTKGGVTELVAKDPKDQI